MPPRTPAIHVRHHPIHTHSMGLIILRCVFLLVAAGLGVSVINPAFLPKDSIPVTWAFSSASSRLPGTIGVDIAIRRKRLDTITAVYFGLLVGLFMTYILGLALVPLLQHRTHAKIS